MKQYNLDSSRRKILIDEDDDQTHDRFRNSNFQFFLNTPLIDDN